jgi:uncharacterized Ntn-hydrolase superfamily protein
MTFSLLGHCPDTGQLGAVVTTSDLAVGARVPYALAGVGVAVTQHRTDPRLGPAMLAELQAGMPPADAVRATARATEHRSWQLGLLDARGEAAAYTGERAWPIAAALAGTDCLALGNMLTSERVLEAMTGTFAAAGGELAPRILAGLRAGQDAGGESGQLRSAALLVVERESFPLVDLRIDAAADPLAALQELWSEYEPRTRDFVTRALDPDNAHGSSSTTT